MRFADTRPTLFKQTDDMDRLHELLDEGPTPTPRLLSPFKPGGYKIRDDVDEAEVYRPTNNRASRRPTRHRRSGHGKRWRRLQHLIKGPRIQDLAAAARNTEGTEAA